MSNDGTGDGAVPEGDSLAPAVTRAAAILDLLAENGSVAAGPSELARRLGLPKSSIANICGALADAGLVRRVGTGFALGRRLAELGGAYLDVGRPRPGVLRGVHRAAHRLRGDGPARDPRRDRDDLPRPARREAARAAHLADRAAAAGQRHGHRQGRARVHRRGRRPAALRGRRAAGLHATLPGDRRRARRRARGRPRTGAMRWTTRRPSRASSASASRSRAGVPARARTPRASRC